MFLQFLLISNMEKKMITGIIHVKFVQKIILMDGFWYKFFLCNTIQCGLNMVIICYILNH